MHKWWLAIAAVAGVFVLIQLVPYGHDHGNPPVTQDAPWADPAARSIALRSCYDCHSNQTTWRWYDKVAPVSWYVQNHISEGRSSLNFSEWDRPQRVGEARETVLGGSMPPTSYTLLHPSAKLSDAEKQVLVAALESLPGQRGGRGGRD